MNLQTIVSLSNGVVMQSTRATSIVRAEVDAWAAANGATVSGYYSGATKTWHWTAETTPVSAEAAREALERAASPTYQRALAAKAEMERAEASAEAWRAEMIATVHHFAEVSAFL